VKRGIPRPTIFPAKLEEFVQAMYHWGFKVASGDHIVHIGTQFQIMDYGIINCITMHGDSGQLTTGKPQYGQHYCEVMLNGVQILRYREFFRYDSTVGEKNYATWDRQTPGLLIPVEPDDYLTIYSVQDFSTAADEQTYKGQVIISMWMEK